MCRYGAPKLFRGGLASCSLCTYNFPMYDDRVYAYALVSVCTAYLCEGRSTRMRTGDGEICDSAQREGDRDRERETERCRVPSVLCRKRSTEGPDWSRGAKGYERNIGTPNGNRYHIYLARCIFNHPARFSERNPLIKLLTKARTSRWFCLSFYVFFRTLVSRPFVYYDWLKRAKWFGFYDRNTESTSLGAAR